MSSVGFNSKLSGIEFRAAGWQGGSGELIYIDFYLLLLKLPPFLRWKLLVINENEQEAYSVHILFNYQTLYQ